jgi:hypothetical protein
MPTRLIDTASAAILSRPGELIMRKNLRTKLSLESCDDRVVPATFTTSHVGGTLIINQTSPAVGAIVIFDNPGAGTVIIDDVGDVNPATVVPTAAYPSLKVNFWSADSTLIMYDIVSARTGNVTLNVKNAVPRGLLFDGGFAVGGNLTVVGGNGGLMVLESVNPMIVSGNATFQGGSGMDMLNLATVSGSTIGGNLTLSKFNVFATNVGDGIAGNLNYNDAGESNTGLMILTDTHVAGNLSYIGGTKADVIVLGGTTTHVDGNVTVNFGSQGAADFSVFSQLPSLTNVIAGNVKISGGALGVENVVLSGEVDGNVVFNLGGGTNGAVINGNFMGSSLRYNGGAGADILNYSPLIGSASAKLKAIMGAGADVILFGPGSVPPSSAYLNFGAGADLLIGAIVFPCTILNLP